METVSCLIKDIADVAYHEADGIISYVKEVAINELKSMPSQMDDECDSLLQEYSKHVYEGSILSEIGIKVVMGEIWTAIHALPLSKKRLLQLSQLDADSLDYYADDVMDLSILDHIDIGLDGNIVREWAYSILSGVYEPDL